DEEPFRFAQFAFGRAGVIGEFARKRSGVEPVRPVDHDRIESLALALQLVPVAMERYRFRNAAVGAGRAGKATPSDPHGPKAGVAWIEPKNAPRSRRRSASESMSAAP